MSDRLKEYRDQISASLDELAGELADRDIADMIADIERDMPYCDEVLPAVRLIHVTRSAYIRGMKEAFKLALNGIEEYLERREE